MLKHLKYRLGYCIYSNSVADCILNMLNIAAMYIASTQQKLVEHKQATSEDLLRVNVTFVPQWDKKDVARIISDDNIQMAPPLQISELPCNFSVNIDSTSSCTHPHDVVAVLGKAQMHLTRQSTK